MIKILVVDDEPDLESLIRQKFRKKIREEEYEFVFAPNGKIALEQMQVQPDISIVLSDINMPEMDGLTLLTQLGEKSPLTKAVMVSAYGDMPNIRTAMNRGAYDFVCKPVDFVDLEMTMEKTIRHVAQIQETLKAIKENNILRMYVDENVLSFMGTKEYEASLMANESIEATIVFIDICGFTAITENAPANTVVNLLNKYFDVMVREIIAQGGHIDKFIGDAVMAVFKGPHHLDNAVEASLNVRKEIEALPKELDETFSPKVAIGINSGEVVSGNIGSVNLRRLDYTSIGDVVNTAQRLQSAAQAGQIVISEDAYEKIKDSFQCGRLGEVTLKNKKAKAVIYEVIL
ncbi:MAG: adenylate/guanylate cyclase domain-containing response regulator [Gammaproteobacteria bacterium]|nr:MAG: adenylate/guanylate cyclase domain-containing response regulator [Gammaproteobacteria bacterium]